MIEAAAAKYGIPVVGLLAMLGAESGLNRFAWRAGTWPDVSGGYCQMTIVTAAGYGLGDGTNTPDNRALVRDLLTNRATAIDVGAHHLSGCYGSADGYDYAAMGLSHDLASLVIYNSGSLPPAGDAWWTKWAGNVANYREALTWASKAL